MECFVDIGITNWNVSLTLEYQMEYIFDIGITNGIFISHWNNQWIVS